MHEMAITEQVLKIVLAAANSGDATRVNKIRIVMGAYSDVVPQIMKEYFEIASKGSIAEGAEITFRRTPVTMMCRTCGWKGTVDKLHISCTACGSTDLKMITGREFYVESIDAD